MQMLALLAPRVCTLVLSFWSALVNPCSYYGPVNKQCMDMLIEKKQTKCCPALCTLHTTDRNTCIYVTGRGRIQGTASSQMSSTGEKVLVSS